MPSEKTLKQIILWLILIIFVSFLSAVVLFILSGDNWFTDYACQSRVIHLEDSYGLFEEYGNNSMTQTYRRY